MKKIFITSIVALALVLVAGSANAQSYVFSNYLKVGSTGADVSALQTWLISQGFDIPSISAGTAAKGYFGQQTKNAVVKYQANVGLPATGYVGPLTVAKLNSGAAGTVVITPVTCPVGYNCVPQNGTIPPVTVTPGAAFVADGTDGSITLSSSSYVSSTQTLKKGDVDKPILSITAKATVGNVLVNRFDVHFNSRPWLLFGRLTLKNVVTGQVLAVKTLSSSADATEVTVGSDYLVRFDNVNAVVTPGMDSTFVATADVLAATDKIPTAGLTITVSTDTNGLRTINGKGYTDSTGLSQTNTIVLSGTGSTGDLLTRVGLNTPDTRTVNVSTTNVTTDQTLGEFDIKLQNQSGTINAVNFQVNSSISSNTSSLTLLATNEFQNFRLYNGSTLLGGAYSVSAANPSVVTFVNLNIPLTVDQYKSLTLKADVLATSSAFSASTTLLKSTVSGVDGNYNTITLTNASNQTANNVTFVPNAGLTLSAHGFTKRNPSTFNTSGQWLTSYPTYTFTINNTGNNPIYISKTASVALATTTSAGAAASTTVSGNLINASGSTTGDTTTSYIINNSRTFTVDFTTDNTNFGQSSKKINITQINYGTSGASDSVDNLLNINYGLDSDYINLP